MKHYLLNHQPQKGLQAACAQQGQAPTCNARGKGHTSASPKTLTKVILVLLTMFLLPSAAWGQGTITVAGNAPESDGTFKDKNSGETITGVTFEESTSTLTLDGATITGSIVKNAIKEGDLLIINLVGTNTVNGQILFQSTDRSYPGDLTFTGRGSLNISDNNSVFDGVSTVNTSKDLYIATDSPAPHCYNGYYVSSNSDDTSVKSLTVSSSVTYPIWVYNNTSTTHYTQLTEAASTFTTPTGNVDENYKGSVSYSENTLTLDNFFCKTTESSVFVFHIGGSLTNLTVDLVGTNETFYNCFNYLKPTDGENLQLTYTTSNNGSLEFNGSPSYGNIDFAYDNDKGLGFYSNKISTDWPRLIVGNKQITGTVSSVEGYDNISYDDKTKTLKLSGTTIGTETTTATSIWVYIKDLKVAISGNNILYGRFYGGYEEDYKVAGKISFLNADFANSSLTISTNQLGVVENFADCVLANGLKITEAKTGNTVIENINGISYENGNFKNGEYVPDYLTISYQAPITVAGVSPDSEGKFSGITGVTFTPAIVSSDSQTPSTPATLTLSGANINGGIVWNSGDPLVIALNGENNNITTTTDHVICGPSAGSSSYPELTFKKANGATSCQLTLTHNANDKIFCIYNFTATNTESGLYYIQNEPTATVTSTLLGGGSGTSTDPFLIKTAQHLQDFASYVNKGIITNEYIQLNNDIDCSSLANFETIGNSDSYFKGTFDGNEKTISNLSVKGKGLFYTDSYAPIKVIKLTLDHLTVTGLNTYSGQIGAIASELWSGEDSEPWKDEIEGCVVKNSLITCENNFGNPWIGGIVGANYGGTITNCIVENTEITASVSNSGQSGPIAKAAGIVCNNSGSVSGCQVKGNTIVTASQESTSDVTAGAILCINSGTLSNNTYEYTVKTRTKGSGEADYTVKQNYDQRGLAASNDIIGEAELAGTKKVTISATGLSGDRRTLSLGEMEDTYCLDERDATTEQLTALYVLPGSTVSLVVSSENGYKPVFTLSNSDVEVTPEEKFANGWTIKYEFSMPEDDVTATIAFAKDLESKNGDAFIYTLSAGQEAYPYTGEAIEPSISLTTDPQNPATLTKGTDYEIKDYFEVKEGVATPMYEEDGTTPKAPINVGSYKISITGKGNYFGTRELEFTIAKSAVDWSDNRWVAPEAKTDLKYTGADMELVTAATVPEGVTIKYYAKYSSTAFNSYDYSASQNEEWSEEVPTGKEIGYYAVFYKVEGGDNYLDWGPSEVGIDVNIDKGEVTISAEAQTVTYNAQQQAYTGASADNENVTLAIAYYPSEEDRTNALNALTGAPTDAGTYYVSVTLNEESLQHYTAEPANVTFTIAQLDISGAVITLDKEELTYNGKVQSVTVEKVMVGDIEVPIDCYEISGNTGTKAENYTLIVTAKTVSNGNEFKNNFTSSAEKDWKIKNRTVTTDELGLSENQSQATYYSETEDLEVPEGVVAYIITGVNGNNVVTQRIRYIPKRVAVFVEQTTSTENPLEVIPDASELPLKGTAVDLNVASISGGTVYVLYKGEFVKSTTGTIPAKRCYLLLPNNVAAGTRAFGIIGGGSDGSTAIKSINDEPSTIDNWYDMGGHRIEKPTKTGIYIKNGKKVAIK